MKYIDAERLKAEIEKGTPDKVVLLVYKDIILSLIDSLQQEETDMGEVSDGYHTFNELYYYRMLYNAAFFNLLPEEWVHKSKKHHDGEECFGGGWFIVMANLPTGQISNHYELKYWDLFKVPEKEFADELDGHTPQEAAERLHKYLQQEQLEEICSKCIHHGKDDDYCYNPHGGMRSLINENGVYECTGFCEKEQEQPEVDLEKFTQNMNDWKARYNHPDNIPIKATMAFTARMFYQYPNVARQWYDSLPKATMN